MLEILAELFGNVLNNMEEKGLMFADIKDVINFLSMIYKKLGLRIEEIKRWHLSFLFIIIKYHSGIFFDYLDVSVSLSLPMDA